MRAELTQCETTGALCKSRYTGCTKSMVHPRCSWERDRLPWSIAYNTASCKQVCLPAARIRLQMDDGRSDEMAVGVSEHIDVDMLLGHDIPQFMLGRPWT